MSIRDNVFADIVAERERQETKWGEQNHPSTGGTFPASWREQYGVDAEKWKSINDERVHYKQLGWDGILLEEVLEALAEEDPERIREELVQVAAVCVNWLECLDRRAEDACPYTHAHTRHWCGRPTCRES